MIIVPLFRIECSDMYIQMYHFCFPEKVKTLFHKTAEIITLDLVT